MKSTFFTIAREGKNTWKDYIKGILTIFSAVIGLGSIAIIIAAFIAGFVGSDWRPSENIGSISDAYNQLVNGDPILDNLAISIGMIGFTIGLFQAVTRVHKRKFLTLVEPSGAVRWSRLAQGFGVWLALDTLATIILLILNPARYDLVFDAVIWIPWTLTAVPVIMLGSVASTLLFYGYFLQGLSLLIRQPIRLLIVWSLIFGTLFSIGAPAYWLLITLRQAFYLWIIYKDDELSLLLGSMLAESLLGGLLFGIDNAYFSVPESPAVFRIAEPLSPVYVVLVVITINSLFYFLCFKKPLGSS